MRKRGQSRRRSFTGQGRLRLLSLSWGYPDTKARLPPNISAGWPIDQYPQGELIALAKWVPADDSQLLTDDEIWTQMMRELGFQRRSAKIVAAIEAAIKRAKAS